MYIKNHFEDCPYGCNVNGMLLDSELGKLVPCPHCSEKKKELLDQGLVETEENSRLSVSSVLGISNDFLSRKFVYDSVIPDGEKLFLKEESLEWQKSESEELYLGLGIGQLPEVSLCFGIGVKGRIDIFAYPIIAKAYMSGLTVAPIISGSEYARMVYNMSDSIDQYIESDFVMVLVNDGCSYADVSCLKGLMQSRALKGKPTIFITTWTIEACSGLLGFKDDASLFLAKPVFVQYMVGKGSKHSKYVNGLLGVENEQYNEESGNSLSMSDLL